MGGGHSAEEHCDRPAAAAHVNVSNKMVERLAEEARGEREPTPSGELRDHLYSERLTCLDHSHSQRCRMTIEDLHAAVDRIESRAGELLNTGPACEHCRRQVERCYEERGEGAACDGVLREYCTCVRAAAVSRTPRTQPAGPAARLFY